MDRLAERLKNLTPLQRAVVALKETQARLDALERRLAEPIAIVGMACRFPGGAVDPRSYWRMLCDGIDAISETPPDRWDVERFYDPDPAAPGKMCSRWGGYLAAIDAFDNRFFGISDREAARIDPQHRFLLELAWEAMEDAGERPSALRGTAGGVFIGISASEYGIMLSNDFALTDSHAAAGTSLCLAANRLSFALGLQGPSLALDTACSSSLVAVHMACQSIHSGECEMALAGGTNLLLSPVGNINLTKSGFCAPDGRVRAFDAAAAGYVRSEGAGIVVLKPLSVALKNRDPIYAVIRGSAVNQNGASNGVTAPSRAAQEQVLREAYRRAKVSPGEIQYVETQGTGTRVGDTIEAAALGSVLGEGRPAGDRCAIGSVKTNLGHMEAASGIASLMKAALALKHRCLPATLHFHEPNPDIAFERLALRVVDRLEPWPEMEQPRRAGVSAFGFGGSNAHVVLEEAPASVSAAAERLDDDPPRTWLLPLSARTEAALRDAARRWVEFFNDTSAAWRDVCYTAAVRRDHHDCRLAVLATSADEARALLESYLNETPQPGVFFGRKPYGRDLKIAFVYDDRTAAGDALLASQLELTAWWRAAGVTPAVVLGHGAGELAAACAAGMLTADEAHHLAAKNTHAGNGAAATITRRAARLPFISSADGRKRAAEALAERGADFCLAIGPCAAPFEEAMKPSLASLGILYAAGVDLTWDPIAPAGARCVRLPAYPWQRQRFWMAPAKWKEPAADSIAPSAIPATAEQKHRPRPELIVPYVAPRTSLEKSLADAWSEVLGLDGIGVHDNFFELGGDSLQATILLNRLREQREDLPPLGAGHVLFEAQTIAELATRFEAAQERVASERGERALLTANRAPQTEDLPRRAPLSLAQQRLWLLDNLDPGGAAYNIPMALRLAGPIDAAALDRAMQEIVARHETLRTKIELVNDEPCQVISPPSPQKLPLVDLSGLDMSGREAAALARAQDEARRPFCLSEGPLFRTLLVRLSATEHILVIVMHHAITDDWSMGVLFQELAALYRAFSSNVPSPLLPLPIQYADYAVRQRQELQGDVLQRLLDYWRGRLAGLPTLELPTDRSRPPQVTHRGAVHRGVLPAELAARVKEVGRREGATLYMTLLAAFEVLLHRYSGQDDFAVGSPIAARLRQDTEGLVGFLANTLVMRADLSGNPSFREAVRRVRQRALEAFQHQEMPLESLVEALNPPRDTSRHPLFQVLFTLQNAPWPTVRLAELSIDYLPLASQTAKFDLWLSLRETDGGLQAEIEYNTDLFDAATIERMLGHFHALLETIAADAEQPIGRVAILTERERQQMLGWNDTAKDYVGAACLHEMVEAQAARSPVAVAVEYEGRQLTYDDLNSEANRLARHLARYGIVPDTAVGVCLERSPEMVVALLAILKAGGAYLPLDPDYPPDRLGFMIDDSRPVAILTTSALMERLPEAGSPVICVDEIAAELLHEASDNLPAKNRLDDVAYVIYTSGSTGRPKGVRNTHRGIANRLLWMQDEYGLSPEDRVLQKTPYSFDVSVWEFFWPLITGARLVLAQPGGHKDPRYLVRLIDEADITTLHFVPSMLALFLEDDEVGRCRSVKRVICSGEALSCELQQRFFARLGAELHNLYGPTEAAVDATYWRCWPGEARTVPIGRPIANMECYILDSHRNLVPIGCPGELHLGGVGLARDYLNRPELTAERFIAHPFSPRPGARLYRTGDLCRWRPDGAIEFLGRLDFQVKIRGNRIELGEVEAALDACPGVRQSVVVVDSDATGPRLVGYIVPRDNRAPTADELHAYLSARLPDVMIPAVFVPLESMPLTASGKIDRKALPAVERQPREQAEYAPPRTETEQQLAAIWQEVLHLDRPGIHDNFFALGGHSLLAAQVVSRIARQLHCELPLREMFQSPTIFQLAERVDAAQSAGRLEPETAIVPAPRDGVMLPSFTQEALWFLDQLERGRATYTIYSPLTIKGRLNVSTVERALNEILRRHEALRTRFPEKDGRPIQVIEAAAPRPLPLVDLAPLPAAERNARLREAIAVEMERPIDLENGPLIRITIYRLADDDHVAMVSAHHMIYDGWSMAVLLKELAALYTAYEQGRESPLEELPIQYADFAAWQRHWLQGETLARLRHYWTRQLAGVAPLELPLDHPRPGIRTTRGATRDFDLPAETAAALLDYCRREGVTPFLALLAAFEIVLSRYSGQDDFAIGTPVANRDRPETEGLIGYFVNVVALRGDLSGDPSFREVLARVRHVALDAYDHQAMTLDQVVAAANPLRDMSRHPLFQVMFALQNIELPQLDAFGLSIAPLEDGPAPRSSYFDLTLAFWQSGGAFRGELNFSTELFDAATMDRMGGHYATLLAAALAAPDQPLSCLPLLGEVQRQQLLVAWNDTAADYPRETCVHKLFQLRAAETPEAEAVVLGDERWTYGELNRRANRLARFLRRQGVGPETRVGICLERSPQLFAVVLAVLKAGGAYVPLDPAFARDAGERMKYMVEDARVSLTLNAASLAAAAADIAAESGANLEPAATAENLAYILYTSGSTGRPKGVMVTHRNLVNAFHGWRRAYRLESDVRSHLQMASFGFDVFAGDMLRGLCSGGRLVICPKETLLDPPRLLELIRREQIACAEFVPVVLRHLVQYLEETDQRLDTLRLAIVGSDAWYVAEHKRTLRRLGPHSRLINSYGLTETTIDSSYFEGDAAALPDAALVPIGRPLANVRLYILDGRMQPAAVGVPGELYIGGDGVARGYTDEELDAQRFVDDPFTPGPKARLCRTGDRARWRQDGQVEFLGRADNQIKIRGFRVEPGEIEEVLGEHSALVQAAVAARERVAGDVRLIAYVVGRSGVMVDVPELKQFLARRVPDYMLPAAFVVLEALPTTASGKVDRNSLPEPDWILAAGQGEYVAPRPGVEERLAAIWSEVLGVERVGAHDNFFDLGGNSLLALRLVARLRSEYAIDLPLVKLFAAPTVAGLAADFEASVTTPHRALVPLRAVGSARPLFCIHGLGGHVAALRPLALLLAEGRPVYGLQGLGLAAGEMPQDSIAAMAACYVAEIRQVQPRGPYLLCGWSMGGLIALEAAKQLQAAGDEVSRLAMFDTYLSADDFTHHVDDAWVLAQIAPQLNVPIAELHGLPLGEQWEKIAELAEKANGIGIVEIRRLAAACKAHLAALAGYRPHPYAGPATLFSAAQGSSGRDRRWKTLCPKLCIEPAAGDHYSMLREPHVRELAARLDFFLEGNTPS